MRILVFIIIVLLSACDTSEPEIWYETKVFEYHADEYMKKYKETENAQLVDIRTENEYRSGHIQYAILIDYYDINFSKMLEQRLDKSQPVFIYCRSGNRTSKSIDIFKKLGFKEINNLIGGYNELLPFVEAC